MIYVWDFKKRSLTGPLESEKETEKYLKTHKNGERIDLPTNDIIAALRMVLEKEAVA